MARRERDISQGRQQMSFDAFYGESAGHIGQALEITLGNRELAEDALNEAMARALQQWKKVSTYDNLEGWVYRVALNWARSWLRRRRRERDRPIHYAPPSVDLAVGNLALRDAVDELTTDHRAVVVCRYFLDWSVSQTAEALGIAEGTVKSRLARAMDNVRTALEVN